MTTTVSIDKEIRDTAAQKAKEDKLSVSAVIRILLLDYVNGKIEIGTRLPEEEIKVETIQVDKDTQELMDDVISEKDKK